MKKILTENRAFLIIHLILLAIGSGILIFISKKDIHLFINTFHNSFFDFFFKYLTYLGDGIAPVLLILFLLFFSFRKSIIVALSSTVAGLSAQFFKRVVFPDVLRPKPYFSGIAELYFVPGVHINTTLSLPSGHTASAFALFFVLSTFTKNKLMKIGCLIMALLIGYSRMYLSQHFLIDVYLGSIIGVLSGIIIVSIVNRTNKPWLDSSLTKLKGKNE